MFTRQELAGEGCHIASSLLIPRIDRYISSRRADLQQRIPWLRSRKRQRHSLLPPRVHTMRWCRVRHGRRSRGSRQHSLLYQRRPD